MLLNDETRSIIVGKVLNRNRDNEKVSYFKFELNENATANVRIPTLRNETDFYMEVEESEIKGSQDPFLVQIRIAFDLI